MIRKFVFFFILSPLVGAAAGRGEDYPRRYDEIIAELRAVFMTSDYERCLELGIKARELAKGMSDTLRIVESSRICGQLYNYLTRPQEAIAVMEGLIGAAQRVSPADYRKILNNIAIAYRETGQYDKALSSLFAALAEEEKYDDPETRVCTYVNIGFVYEGMGDLTNALVFFRKGLKVPLHNGDVNPRHAAICNVGYIHLAFREYDRADSCFRVANEMNDGTIDASFRVKCYQGMAAVRIAQGRYSEAEESLQNADEISRDKNITMFVAENAYLFGKLETARGRLQSAISYLDSAERICVEHEYIHLLIEVYQLRATIHELDENFKAYKIYIQRWAEIKNRVYAPAVLSNVVEARIQYAQWRNLATIGAHAEVIDNQRKTNLWLSAVVAIGCIVLFFLVRNLRKLRLFVRRMQGALFRKSHQLKEVSSSSQNQERQWQIMMERTSNDIRAPLATLKGVCNVAMLDVKDETSKLYLTRISETTQKLESVLERLGKGETQAVFVKLILDESIKKFQRSLIIESHVDDDFSLPVASTTLNRVFDDVISTLASGMDGGSWTMTIKNSRQKSLHFFVTTNASNFALDELTQRLAIMGVRVLINEKDNITELSLVF
jgi:tetratricopeptide (TPR) repeat protein